MRACLLLIAWCTASCAAGAPEGRADAPAPRVVTSADRLAALLAELPEAPADSLTEAVAIEQPDHAVERLRAALARIAEHDDETRAQARVVMLGSSHVGGDLVSSFLRQRLQHHFGDAGHGFVVAVPPYADYWQEGVRVAEGEGWQVVDPYGKVARSDAVGPVNVGYDANEPSFAELSAERAARIELMFLRQPSGGALSVAVDGVMHAIETAAPSTGAGIAYFGVADGPHDVRIEAHGEGPVRVFGAVFERESDGVLVDQLGLNAMTAAHYLLNEPTTQRTFLSSRRADLFVVWLGTNEASETWPIALQTERFEQLLDRLSAAWPAAGCLVLGPLDRRQHDPEGHPFVPPALAPIRAMQREIALARGCGFFDSYRWQGGDGAVERFLAADPPLMRPDRVHLTELGYRRYAADLLRALAVALRDDA